MRDLKEIEGEVLLGSQSACTTTKVDGSIVANKLEQCHLASKKDGTGIKDHKGSDMGVIYITHIYVYTG